MEIFIFIIIIVVVFFSQQNQSDKEEIKKKLRAIGFQSGINRLKLISLPIVKDTYRTRGDVTEMDMIRIIMSNLEISPISCKAMETKEKLKLYSDTELKKLFSTPLMSLAQADAHMIERKTGWKTVGLKAAWKIKKKILIYYTSCCGLLIPSKFIVRTGETSWTAWQLPFLGNDDIHENFKNENIQIT